MEQPKKKPGLSAGFFFDYDLRNARCVTRRHAPWTNRFMAFQYKRCAHYVKVCGSQCVFFRVPCLPAYVAAQVITNVARHVATRARCLRVINVIEADECTAIQRDNCCLHYLFRARHPLALSGAARPIRGHSRVRARPRQARPSGRGPAPPGLPYRSVPRVSVRRLPIH